MRGSAAFCTGVAPGGALAGPWVKDPLWRNAQAVPSLDLNFAGNKSLVDSISGQNLITFTRSSSGTYVGSDGVLKTATTNLLLRSEEFDNAVAWQNQGSTDAANSATAPNGALTADEVIEDSTTANHYITQSFTSITGIVYTFSCYVKAANRTFCFLIANGAGTVHAVSINLSTGVTSSATGSPSNITSVSIGNGWYRVSFTYTSGTTGAVGHEVRLSTDGVWANRSYTGNGTGSVYVWGAQLEQSSTVGEYIPTTSTINSAPRFDHNPTTGESLGLLVEEQRTNSIRNNTMVGAVAGTPGTLPTNWVIGGGGLGTLSQQVVGIGSIGSLSYIDVRYSGTTSTTGFIFAFEPATQVAALTAQSWASSFYVALVGGSLTNINQLRHDLVERTSAGGAVLQNFSGDFKSTLTSSLARSTYAVTLSGGATTAFVQPSIEFNFASGVAIDITLRIGLPQLEQGAFATSVIPTTGTTATRSADVASITGTNFSSWYRQDEGTVFADVDRNTTITAPTTVVSINDNTTNNRLLNLRQDSSSQLTVVSQTGGVLDGSPQVSLINTSARNKVAAAQALNNLAVSANGGAAVADTSVAMPTVNQMQIGNVTNTSLYNGTIRRLTYWPARLPNSTLQAITQ